MARRFARTLLGIVVVVGVVIGFRIVLGLLLRPTSPNATPEEMALRVVARDIHWDALLIDAHNDVLWAITDYGFDLAMDGDETDDRSLFFYSGLPWLPNPPTGDRVRSDLDLARAREGGLNAQFFPAYVACTFLEIPGASRQWALAFIEQLREQVRRHPDDLEIAYTAEEVERIVSEGKLAAITAVEGGHAIEDDLAILEEFYELGVRYLTLTHTCSNSWADSSADDSLHGGLTEFGRDVVREMNRLGMIVDVSHASDDTFWDVIDVTAAPVMASHSNARAMADHPRNLSDAMLRAVARTNGVVMVNFMPFHLDPEKTAVWKLASGWHWFTHPGHPETPLSLLIDHIDHIVEVAGIDHVGLGSDFDNVTWAPKDLTDVSDFPNLTLALVRRGYSDEEARKILGANTLRLLAEADEK